MFDLIFSLVILIVTLGVIFSYFVGTKSNDDIYDLGLQIIDSYTQTQINALNDKRIRDMFRDSNIRKMMNVENTVAQQATQFRYYGRNDLAIEITNISINPYVKEVYSYNLSLINGTGSVELFSFRGVDSRDFDESKISTRLQRDILGYVNRTVVYEGFTVRLDIWI